MSGTTIKEFSERLHESKSESFRKRNPHVFGGGGENRLSGGENSSARVSRPREEKDGTTNHPATKTPEEKLNKLERRWLAVLRTRYSNPGIQNITLRLSDDLRYTPDLNSNQAPLAFFETKGLHRFREKGILKLRWAAKEYPFFDFYLVTWDKDTQKWTETLIAKE